MRFTAALSAAFSLLLVSACSMPADGGNEAPLVSPILTSEDARDIQTFADPEKARVTHVDLDLDLDFDRQMVSGTAMLDIIAEADVDTVVLASGDGDFDLLLLEIRRSFDTSTEVYGVPALTANSLINAANIFNPIKTDLLL